MAEHIDKHEQVDIPLVTAGAVIKTQKGEVIAIVHRQWSTHG